MPLSSSRANDRFIAVHSCGGRLDERSSRPLEPRGRLLVEKAACLQDQEVRRLGDRAALRGGPRLERETPLRPRNELDHRVPPLRLVGGGGGEPPALEGHAYRRGPV